MTSAVTCYRELLDRVEYASDLLTGEDRGHARRVVELCRGLDVRPRVASVLVPSADDLGLKRELGRLVEVLGRRATQALPAATLGRAALADLHGDARGSELACKDCAAKLAMLGF
jgi:hypothetical protein